MTNAHATTSGRRSYVKTTNVKTAPWPD